MEWFRTYQHLCNATITSFLDDRYEHANLEGSEKNFIEALRYAVEGDGKRLRPILAILAYESVSGMKISQEKLIPLLGIEMIHGYTLVHDDLPAMDNDEYRRGELTVWKKYGETMAILVGDALQTLGFEMLASSGKSEIVGEISHTLGDLGVVRGQVRDTLEVQTDLTLDALLSLQEAKTGGFIASSLVIGAMLADADESRISEFREFGSLLGRAFQIRDDILDFESSGEILGKATGKDVALGKGIVAKVGIEESREMLARIREAISEYTEKFDDEKLSDLAFYIIDREK